MTLRKYCDSGIKNSRRAWQEVNHAGVAVDRHTDRFLGKKRKFEPASSIYILIVVSMGRGTGKSVFTAAYIRILGEEK